MAIGCGFPISESFRVVQLTPPGSACSIQFGVGLAAADSGSAQTTYVIVSDIDEARAGLIDKGADVGEVFHRAEGEEVSGPDPIAPPTAHAPLQRSGRKYMAASGDRRAPVRARIGKREETAWT